jgi:hypothetical protein
MNLFASVKDGGGEDDDDDEVIGPMPLPGGLAEAEGPKPALLLLEGTKGTKKLVVNSPPDDTDSDEDDDEVRAVDEEGDDDVDR